MISLATEEEKDQILQTNDSSSMQTESEAEQVNDSSSIQTVPDTDSIPSDEQIIQQEKAPDDTEEELEIAAEEIEEEEEAPEEIEEDSVEGLLNLAKEAQEKAKNASLAAQNAAETVRRTVIDTDFPSSETSQKLRQMQYDTSQKALLAAQASLEAQESAYEASAAAFAKAQNAMELSKNAREQVKVQREKLGLKLEEAKEIAETAAEEAEVANHKARETSEKRDAYHAAYLASQTLEEEAAVTFEKNQNLLAETKEKTEEIYLDLLSLRNMEMLLEQQVITQPEEKIVDEPDQEPILETIPEPPKEETPAKPTKEKKAKKSGIAIFFSYFKVVLLALIIALLLRTYVFETTKVVGDSMLPGLQDGNSLITSKINYRIWEPQRGDIVIVEAPDRYNEYYIKRIIGMPNERITIKDGKVYINSSLLDEPYMAEGTQTNGSVDMLIESNAYFVMGDNREASHDSRSSAVGTISLSNIKGKAIFRFYPFSEIGMIE